VTERRINNGAICIATCTEVCSENWLFGTSSFHYEDQFSTSVKCAAHFTLVLNWSS